jgi:pSer/pThr/pTyr-binding forkhead associated (FHA) protein
VWEEPDVSTVTLVMERTPLRVYELDRPIIQIGRAEGMEIVIDNVSVSRAQAEIRQEKRGWAIRDLGSANGTFVNGERVTASRTLRAGDEISFGKFSLFFDRPFTEPLADPVSVTPSRGRANAPGTYHASPEEIERLNQVIASKRRAQIEWEVAGLRGTHYLDGDRVVVGQAEECDVRVPAGAAREVLIVRGESGYEIESLAPRWQFTRLKVNGRTTRRATLRSRDRIESGPLCLTFLEEV